MAAVAAILGHGIEHSVEHPGPDPGLVAAMAGLVGRVARGQILPGGAGLEDPEDPVQYIARVAPRAPSPIRPAARLGQQRFEHGPLSISEVHEPTPGPRAPGV